MALAFRHLALSPAQFWRLTPREIALMLRLRADRGGGRPTRLTLEALMKRYPDRRI